MKKLFLYCFLFFGMVVLGQKQDAVDFLSANVHISPEPKTQTIKGSVNFEFKVLANIDSVFLDAQSMSFSKVLLNKDKVGFKTTESKLILYYSFRRGKKYSLQLEYDCKPKQTVYFNGFKQVDTLNTTLTPYNEQALLKVESQEENIKQIWTQGQGKYTSHWLPSFDEMTEKLIFNLAITFDKDFDVIANGALKEIKETATAKTWMYSMQEPMSSYLVAFVIGKYKKQSLFAESGIPIENYYYPTNLSRVEPTFRYTKQIFDFLEKEIGVPYPWQNYKQVPVKDFLYAGMENTSTTVFSDGFMIDSTAFVDKNYVNVNAHELAHQWFGNLVTEQSGNHHWLQEGFATYYAYLCEKDIFGNDHFFWKLFETAKELRDMSYSEKGESLLDSKATSLTFYEKGAWALVMLKDLVGEDNFKNGMEKYLRKFQYYNATIDEFLKEMESASNYNLSEYKEKWLESTTFPWEESKAFLMANCTSINQYYKINETSKQINEYYKDSLLTLYWTDSTSLQLKKQFIYDYKDHIRDQKLADLLLEEPIEVRQALAISREKIFIHLRPLFESMLLDKSYITIETALYKLWNEFPEDQMKFLNATKNIEGLPNKNVKLLWLALATITPEYTLVQRQSFLKELQSYTFAGYDQEIRSMAFQYLSDINLLNGKALKQLIIATNHPSWRFRDFTRRLLDKQLTDVEKRKEIELLANTLSSIDLRYLKTKL